jgi:hypothetical protein
MLDAILLLNEEQVSAAIRGSLARIAAQQSGFRKRVALYAEREFPEHHAFRVKALPDSKGIVRQRAVGRSGPAAVRPVRGSTRVGSEGYVAFIISQAVKAWPKIYANHPGPDRVRSKRSPIGTLAIVTDFIGSGTRVCTMLDKFWNVPSVRAWVSRGWVEFLVVTAAGTNDGIQSVRNHRVSPEVFVHYIAPTLSTASDGLTRADWEHLIT